MTARTGAIATGDRMPPAMSGTVSIALMFEALLHTIGMAFLLLAMMKEQAEFHSILQLRELALQDGLTGLGNRRSFDAGLDREFHRMSRNHDVLAMLTKPCGPSPKRSARLPDARAT